MTMTQMPVLVTQEELDALVGEVELFLRANSPPPKAPGVRLSRGGRGDSAAGDPDAAQPPCERARSAGRASAWLATSRTVEVSALARQRSPPEGTGLTE